MKADELVEELVGAVIGGWIACSLCGARVEAGRVPKYTCKVYLKLAKTQSHVRRNI